MESCSIMQHLPSIVTLLYHALINMPSVLVLGIFRAIDVFLYCFQQFVCEISVMYVCLYHSTAKSPTCLDYP
jgi:hypothetical protein